MIFMRDCPRCGTNRIRSDVTMCGECEIDERWGARYQAEVDRYEAALAKVRAALCGCIEVIDALKPPGKGC